MTAAAQRLMTADEFLLWALEQEDKYELVDGVPVAKYAGPEMMANGRRNHARVIGNLSRELGNRLRGGPCEVYGDTFSVRVSIRKQRRPDVIVDCGPGRGSDLEATAPTVLFEVLSPTSWREDMFIKPEEYKRLATLRHYVVVDPDKVLLKIWSRDAEGRWSDDTVRPPEETLSLPALAIELPLSEVYEGVDFDAA